MKRGELGAIDLILYLASRLELRPDIYHKRAFERFIKVELCNRRASGYEQTRSLERADWLALGNLPF